MTPRFLALFAVLSTTAAYADSIQLTGTAAYAGNRSHGAIDFSSEFFPQTGIESDTTEHRWAVEMDLNSVPTSTNILQATIRLRTASPQIARQTAVNVYVGNGIGEAADLIQSSPVGTVTYTPPNASPQTIDVTNSVKSIFAGKHRYVGFELEQSPLVSGDFALWDSINNANFPILTITTCTAIPHCGVITCTTANDQVCGTCDANYYKDGNGQCIACSGACLAGQYQSAACTANADRSCAGCSAIAHCQGGITCSSSSDSLCGSGSAAGYYLVHGAADSCSQCTTAANCDAAHTVCTTSSDQTCTACLSGYWDDGGTCVACSIGCAQGQYESALCSASADRKCTDCDANCATCSDSAAHCTGCQDGYHLDTKSNSCVACTVCQPGQKQDSACTATTDATCSSCPAGTYSSASGATSCTSCANNCDDGDACTTDSCDPVSGCTHMQTCDMAVGSDMAVSGIDRGSSTGKSGCSYGGEGQQGNALLILLAVSLVSARRRRSSTL